MKKLGFFVIIAAILISLSASDGFAFQLGGKEMVKNGSGTRSKFLIGTLYFATLWVPAPLKGKTGKEIIEANEPMSVVLVLESKLITRERFVESTAEGFGKSAAAGYPTASKQAFLDQYKNVTFQKGDIVNMSYTPAGLTVTYKSVKTGKVETLGTIAGLDLKKALFAIWLGSSPIQESLKNELLSGK
jgi:hypothetical protein